MSNYRIAPDREPSSGWKILSLAGIPFYVEPSFLIVTAIFMIYDFQQGVPLAAAGMIGLVIFFSLLIHEAGHAFTARLFGQRGISVSLVALGGYTRHPPSTRGRSLLIVLAGPLATFLIVAGSLGLIFLLPQLAPRLLASDRADSLFLLLGQTFLLNKYWLIFNLLPIYPLDGGKTVFYLFSYLFPEVKALLTVAVISMLVCVLGGLWAYKAGQMFVAYFMVMFFLQNLRILKDFRQA